MEDAQVRYEALRSLMNFSPRQHFNEIAPLLTDKVRAVRIAAALANLPRINLSVLYNSQGRNKEALSILETAAKTDSKNAQVFYDLALLHNEMNNKDAALRNFQKAYELKLQDPRLYYNYALLLQQMRNSNKAIKILESGLKIDRSSTSINYALAFIYSQNRQTAKAQQYAIILKKLDPNNRDYQQLFAALGIN